MKAKVYKLGGSRGQSVLEFVVSTAIVVGVMLYARHAMKEQFVEAVSRTQTKVVKTYPKFDYSRFKPASLGNK